jgi:hypothetical protein
MAGRRGDNQMISHPPQLPSYGITRDVRMRYQTGAAVDASITFQNLLDTVLVAVSATSGYDVFDAVRVNSVEAWAAPVTGAPVTIGISYNGETVGAAGDQKQHTDTSMGIQPAHVKARPDALTQAGQFQASSANTAFTLFAPANTVVDVSLTLRQPMFAQATVAQNPLAGAATGALYYRGLDGKGAATTSFPVQGAFASV